MLHKKTISLFGIIGISFLLSCERSNTEPLITNEDDIVISSAQINGTTNIDLMADEFHALSKKLHSHEIKLKKLKNQSIFEEKLKNAKSVNELKIILSELTDSPDVIINSVTKLQALAKGINIKNSSNSKLFVQSLSNALANKRIINNTEKVAKSDCLGVCSQQYNVDIEACDLGLAIGVAGAVLGGAMSAGMAGAGIWMTVAAGYLVCENAAIGSLDTCGAGCDNYY